MHPSITRVGYAGHATANRVDQTGRLSLQGFLLLGWGCALQAIEAPPLHPAWPAVRPLGPRRFCHAPYVPLSFECCPRVPHVARAAVARPSTAAHIRSCSNRLPLLNVHTRPSMAYAAHFLVAAAHVP